MQLRSPTKSLLANEYLACIIEIGYLDIYYTYAKELLK